MNIDEALQTFIVESRELLDDMEAALLAIRRSDDTGETVNAIFRAAHTIKGSAGLFGLEHVVSFTHVLESVLDRVRDGAIPIAADLIELLLACADHIRSLIDAIDAGRLEADAALDARGAPFLQQLRDCLGATQGPDAVDARTAADRPGEPGTDGRWHISLRFGPDVLRNGMDPLSFIRYLGQIGNVAGIAVIPDALPAAEDMDAESCYLGFEIAFVGNADKAAIENVFEFVRDDCRIRILPPNSQVTEYIRLIDELPEDATRLGEMLVRCGSVTARELEAALAAQRAAAPVQAIGAILVEQGAVQPAVVDAAVAKQDRIRDGRTQESRSIRVDADKLDQLINLVGELIIAGASANAVAQRMCDAELQECASTLSSLVEQVRDSALQLRMVKIGTTFSRFQRVVHDVSRELGKDIGLAVSGEDTELDKTIIERIADPLTHLVRNAIDHGIEAAEVRAARGKPARGTVTLNAFHDSGSIVIEVGDDGGGLKRERIVAKALERGLIEADRVLTDSEVFGLIFEPGFSTAEQVTNLSGRGVGMDVVKRNITALRGSVGVASREGVGTTVTVRLPLTLAIIDGFLVGLGESAFVVPLDMIEECIEFGAGCDVGSGRDFTNLRGQVLPFIRLRELFGLKGPAVRRESIVVVRHAGQKLGIVVDSLLGEFQTVIKPLSRIFNQVRCISGSTILGSGEVALIVDVPALAKHAGEAEAHTEAFDKCRDPSEHVRGHRARSNHSMEEIS